MRRDKRRRTSSIHRGKLRAIGRRLPPMLNLRRNWRDTLLVQNRNFRRRRPGIESAAPAVIADPGHGNIRNSVVIDVVNDGPIHVVNGAVIVEGSPVPISALVTVADITEPVIDSAIEADVRAPISGVPVVAAAEEPPVRRCPEPTHIRRNYPYARHPIIAR